MQGPTPSPPVDIRPFVPVLSEESLADLRQRLSRSRLAQLHDDSWRLGAPRSWLSALLVDWQAVDIAGLQARLERLPHVTAAVDEQRIHLLHAPGVGTDPFPLLLTHGWPGSFLEHVDLLARLTDPEAHGGDPNDAFAVVVPSLPGFGFSSPPPAGGLSARVTASLLHRVMTEGLGYESYAAHGSDLGAGVTAWLARDHPDEVSGIHLATPGLAAPPTPWSAAEQAYADEVEAWSAEEGGYAHQHATKPGTLAAALLDSPAGLAAWIGEKITSWSSTTADGQPRFPRQLLLDTLTLYWATGTIGTSLLPYWAYRHAEDAALPAGQPPPVPTAISVFGGERVPFPKPPRELAERYFSITSWAEHERGGHFPAVAEPDLLAGTLREVFRPLRRRS